MMRRRIRQNQPIGRRHRAGKWIALGIVAAIAATLFKRRSNEQPAATAIANSSGHGRFRRAQTAH